MPGSYQLVEIKAPDGYVIATNAVKFDLAIGEDGLADVAITSGDNATKEDASSSQEAAVTVSNTPGTALPSTGGPGNRYTTWGGIFLLLASVAMYGFKMKRREMEISL